MARRYLCAYATGAFENTRAVIYDFCESRAGEHARTFPDDWKGSLVCDDFSGYKACFEMGVTEAGCLAHARRKFFELHAANQSQIAQSALEQLARIYEIEREVKELSVEQRLAVRRERTRHVLDATARVADATAAQGARRVYHRPSARLQPQTLGRAHQLRR